MPRAISFHMMCVCVCLCCAVLCYTALHCMCSVLCVHTVCAVYTVCALMCCVHLPTVLLGVDPLTWNNATPSVS